LEKVECPIEEEKWKRVIREWQRIDSINREARLEVENVEVISLSWFYSRKRNMWRNKWERITRETNNRESKSLLSM
jgi:hypothetical protein